MYPLQNTPRSGLDVLEITKIITVYRFYYSVKVKDFSKVYGGQKYSNIPFNPFLYKREPRNTFGFDDEYVTDGLNLSQLERDFKGSKIIQVKEIYLPRFEEESWRKTNGYIKLD